jgi:hypothetical protein
MVFTVLEDQAALKKEAILKNICLRLSERQLRFIGKWDESLR